ncbi:MAG TPA: hypothetical protein VJS15_10425, partial [Allosphingosinicella sp.]|nr:hypothetical protein [Allosphingosinicella sp.]
MPGLQCCRISYPPDLPGTQLYYDRGASTDRNKESIPSEILPRAPAIRRLPPPATQPIPRAMLKLIIGNKAYS